MSSLKSAVVTAVPDLAMGHIRGTLVPSDTLPPSDEDSIEGSDQNHLKKRPPPNYLVLRSNNLKPERLAAASDTEALEIIQRQVRTSSAPFVCLYKLIGAERYVPSSEFLPPEQMDVLFKD